MLTFLFGVCYRANEINTFDIVANCGIAVHLLDFNLTVTEAAVAAPSTTTTTTMIGCNFTAFHPQLVNCNSKLIRFSCSPTTACARLQCIILIILMTHRTILSHYCNCIFTELHATTTKYKRRSSC